MIILDFGSGETCRNDWATAKRMVDELAAVDSRRHNVVIKWQLFTRIELPPEVVHSGSSGGATELLALERSLFLEVMRYARRRHAYFTTASVFDMEMVLFLAGVHQEEQALPFVKLATRPDLYHLARHITCPIMVSVPDARPVPEGMHPLYCVREYPAEAAEYERRYGRNLTLGISDHTDNFGLFHKYQPRYFECHYRLPDSIGLDSGPWARTPSMLREILT